MRTRSPTFAAFCSSCAWNLRRAADDLLVLGCALIDVDPDDDRLVHRVRHDDAAALLAPAELAPRASAARTIGLRSAGFSRVGLECLCRSGAREALLLGLRPRARGAGCLGRGRGGLGGCGLGVGGRLCLGDGLLGASGGLLGSGASLGRGLRPSAAGSSATGSSAAGASVSEPRLRASRPERLLGTGSSAAGASSLASASSAGRPRRCLLGDGLLGSRRSPSLGSATGSSATASTWSAAASAREPRRARQRLSASSAAFGLLPAVSSSPSAGSRSASPQRRPPPSALRPCGRFGFFSSAHLSLGLVRCPVLSCCGRSGCGRSRAWRARSRALFSSAPVADWKRRLKSSLRTSARRCVSSSSLRSLQFA